MATTSSGEDDQNTTSSEEAKHQASPPHPITVAIDGLVHRSRDIKAAAGQFLPQAIEARRERFEEIQRVLKEKGALLEDTDNHTRVLAQKEVHETLGRFYRFRRSSVPDVLERGLFLALFSAFDAFTGDLVRGIYSKRPSLFSSLNKSIPFEDVLIASSIDALKLQVLDDDIETLRRKSYVDQFATLAQRFDVKLTVFDRWPDFVECSQRRNLLTHCDGVVTDQYLQVCRQAGIPLAGLPAVGSKIKLGATYFYAACELVLEVGLKLGQTLWRKTLPDELGEADSQLMRTIYEALENHNWARARTAGEFAFNQRTLFSDSNRKIIIVNYAQALKRNGAIEEAKKILGDIDWSAAANDFKLARAVLLEDYNEACNLMKKIGLKGEFLNETGYHTWPLFIEFRETDQFMSTYLEVFGHPYSSKLREEADQASKKAGEEAQKESGASLEIENVSSTSVNDCLDQPSPALHQTSIEENNYKEKAKQESKTVGGES